MDKKSKKNEKKKQKLKAKESFKKNLISNEAQQESRKAEQEMVALLTTKVDLKIKEQFKDPMLQSKLGNVNAARAKMDLMPKTMADYELEMKRLKKDKKKGILSIPVVRIVPKGDASYDSSSGSDHDNSGYKTATKNQHADNTEYQDLSHIWIPKGAPPETDGQIFHGLVQLHEIKSKSQVPPPPPPLNQSADAFPVFAPLPTFAALPFVPLPGFELPMVPPSMPNVPLSTLMVPLHKVSMVPPDIHPPLSNQIPRSENQHRSRLYSKQSHAPSNRNIDPLEPEIDEAEIFAGSKKARSEVVISAAPVMRNFVKEVVGLVPRNVKRAK